MQRLILRSTTGIPSTFHSLAILRHFEQTYGPAAFSNYRAPRDPVTHRHNGYIIVDAPERVANQILSHGQTHSIILPSTGSIKGKEREVEPVQKTKRQKIRLDEVIELFKEQKEQGVQEDAETIEVHVEEARNNDEYVPVVRRSDPPLPSSFPSALSSSSTSDQPEPLFTPRISKIPSAQLNDLFTLFDGFATPGRLKKSSRTSRSEAGVRGSWPQNAEGRERSSKRSQNALEKLLEDHRRERSGSVESSLPSASDSPFSHAPEAKRHPLAPSVLPNADVASSSSEASNTSSQRTQIKPARSRSLFDNLRASSLSQNMDADQDRDQEQSLVDELEAIIPVTENEEAVEDKEMAKRFGRLMQ